MKPFAAVVSVLFFFPSPGLAQAPEKDSVTEIEPRKNGPLSPTRRYPTCC